MGTLQQDPDLRLRPVSLPDDARLALPWYADPEVLDLSEDGADPYDEATIAKMYAYFLREGEAWIIEVLGEDGAWLAVGDVALTTKTVPVVIGDPAWRNRGLGKRVLRLVIEHARDLGWDRIRTKGIWVRNVRSRRVFEAVGFRLVKTGPDDDGRECWFHELDLGGTQR